MAPAYFIGGGPLLSNPSTKTTMKKIIHPPAPVAPAEQPATTPSRLITYQVAFGRIIWRRSLLYLKATSKSKAVAQARAYARGNDLEALKDGHILFDHLGIASVEPMWDDQGNILENRVWFYFRECLPWVLVVLLLGYLLLGR